ncbi:hypothetical protein K4K52_001530 [Colletotrichum sp. SAR 10_76]|nr:hypothetical protein K4K52_001530 [Colletotrichum sp. SAR 10_76]
MYQCYFPFLSEKDLEVRWENGISDIDGPSYALLMSLCAVSSQMAAMNAVFDDTLLQGISIPDSELYFTEAVSNIPVHIPQSQNLDYLRSFGLLHGCKNRKAVLAVLYDKPAPTTLLNSLAQLKANKSRILLGLTEADGEFQSNRCKYMSVQITCTETLVNIMALLYCQAPAQEVMTLANSFLEELKLPKGSLS